MNATPYRDHVGHHGRLVSPTRGGAYPRVEHPYRMRGPLPHRAMTAVEAAARLGYPEATVRRWIVLGWLRAGWTITHAKGGQRRYVVSEEALWDFAADPRAFPYLDHAHIPETDLREWAARARSGSDWLTAAAAGARFGYYPPYISRLALKGRIRRLRFRHASRPVYSTADLAAYAAGAA